MGIFRKIYIWNLRRKLYKKEEKEKRIIWCKECKYLGRCDMRKKIPEAIFCGKYFYKEQNNGK